MSIHEKKTILDGVEIPSYEEMSKMSRHEIFTVMITRLEKRLEKKQEKHRQMFDFWHPSTEQKRLYGEIEELQLVINWVKAFWIVLK